MLKTKTLIKIYLATIFLLFHALVNCQTLSVGVQHKSRVEAVVSSKDGEFYASRAANEVIIWDAKNGIPLDIIKIQNNVLTFVFSNDSKNLHIISTNAEYVNYDIKNKNKKTQSNFIKFPEIPQLVFAQDAEETGRQTIYQAISPSESKFIFATSRGVYIFDLTSEFKLIGSKIFSIAIVPPGTYKTWCDGSNARIVYVEWITENKIALYNGKGAVCEIDSKGVLQSYVPKTAKFLLEYDPSSREKKPHLFITALENQKSMVKAIGKYGFIEKSYNDNTVVIKSNAKNKINDIRPAKIIFAKFIPGTSSIAMLIESRSMSQYYNEQKIKDLIVYDYLSNKTTLKLKDIANIEVTQTSKLIVSDNESIKVFLANDNFKQICNSPHGRLNVRNSDPNFRKEIWTELSLDDDKEIIGINFLGSIRILNVIKCENILENHNLERKNTDPFLRGDQRIYMIKGTNKFVAHGTLFDYQKKSPIGTTVGYGTAKNIGSIGQLESIPFDSQNGFVIFEYKNGYFWWDFNSNSHCKLSYWSVGMDCTENSGIFDDSKPPRDLIKEKITGNVWLPGLLSVQSKDSILTYYRNSLNFYSNLDSSSKIKSLHISIPDIVKIGKLHNEKLLPMINSNGVLYLVNIRGSSDAKNALDHDFVRINIDSNNNIISSINNGYFAVDGQANINEMGIVFNQKLFELESLWDVFHRPDIIRSQLMGESIRPLIGDLTIEKAIQNPPPNVALTIPASDSTSSRVKLPYTITPNSGGIAEVRIFHNGKLISSDGTYKDAPGKAYAPVGGKNAEANLYAEAQQSARNAGLLEPTNSAAANQVGSLRNQLIVRGAPEKKCNPCKGEIEIDVIPGEENTVSVVAFNRDNTIQSVPASVTFKSTLPKEEPHLWLLSVGINQFQGITPLVNAKKDALDFACTYAGMAALTKLGLNCSEAGRAQSLFKPQNIHVVDALLDAKATKANIQGALDKIASQAKPGDTFVWFVASHGMMDANSLFGIVAHDTKCLNDKCTDISGHITSNEILEASKKIKAMKQLMVLDTCHSGGLDSKMSGLYDARMSLLAKNMGLHMYASAQATEQAQDGIPGSNGTFTAQLLEGIKGAAPKNSDGFISVMTLGQYAKQKTIEATQAKGGANAGKAVQTPVIQHFGLDAALVGVGVR